MDAEPQPTATLTANVRLNLSGTTVDTSFTVPKATVPLRAMLPVLRSFAETIVGEAVAREVAGGRTISCRAGCGACCRQLVPISVVEAHQLCDLVEGFPEPRRTDVRARFQEAHRRLDEAGLTPRLLPSEPFANKDELRGLGMEYFALGIPCPFLEQESCSIYEERPISCREYLVTSPAEHCARPTAETIECVPLPARVSTTVNGIAADETGRVVGWVPLVLALEWAESEPDALAPRPGPEWMREVIRRVTGREIPPPPGQASEESRTG